MIGKDVGDWDCDYCKQHGRHIVNCIAPSGRCHTCNEPYDDHLPPMFTAAMRCPARSR